VIVLVGSKEGSDDGVSEGVLVVLVLGSTVLDGEPLGSYDTEGRLETLGLLLGLTDTEGPSLGPALGVELGVNDTVGRLLGLAVGGALGSTVVVGALLGSLAIDGCLSRTVLGLLEGFVDTVG